MISYLRQRAMENLPIKAANGHCLMATLLTMSLLSVAV